MRNILKYGFILISLLLNTNLLIGQCQGNVTYVVDVPPGPGNTYPPNTTVELCITMDGWNGNGLGSNWLEGFGLDLGVGWETITPVSAPTDSDLDGSGTWIWVNSVTSDATGLTAGPGYFFEGPTGPLDGNPGNDWGDSCPSTTCVWSFCVDLTTSNTPGLDLHIGVNVYADGTMGSWGTQSCDDPETSFFDGTIGCFIPGCTDSGACNYNQNADCDDGSCVQPGCTDPVACNYNELAPCDDGSCTYGGCVDPDACNFNPDAGCDDGSCSYFSMGDITHNLMPCPDTVCTGLVRTYQVTGNESSSFNWWVSDNNSQLDNLNQNSSCTITWGETAGNYTVSVQEITEAGCLGQIENCDVVVIQPDIIFDSSYRICYNQSVLLNASPSGGYWTGNNVSGNTFIGYFTGMNYPTYNVNIYGCDISESIDVTVEPLYQGPMISYSKLNIDLCFDPSDQTYIATDDRSTNFYWSVDNLSTSSENNNLYIDWPDTTNTYLISVYGVDSLGCQSSNSSINLHTESCQRFFAPNSFTPNGDGINDIFKISGLSVYKPQLRIFDRWGIEIYRSDNLYWTGDGGTGYFCNNDIYTWVVEYKDKDGFHKKEQGFVSLIR